MPTPTIPAGNLYMNATLYTGNGTTQTITNGPAGASFQPDFVWLKARSNAYTHVLVDSIRGTDKVLSSASTSAENSTNAGEDFTAFNSNGFSVGIPVSFNSTNANGATIVGWQWKAGGTAVSNTAGSITSSVSANTTSGFSIVTYTGNSTNPSTVGHGLGVAPQFIIIKCRSNAYNWVVGSKAIDGFSSGKQLYLNTTSALVSAENFFSNTQPTSTVFTVKDNYEVNFSGYTYVAYCFAPIAGYSAFGSYTGNGSTDGPFIYLGFRPKFLMVKRTDGIQNWTIYDSVRDTYNVEQNLLAPNTSGAEATYQIYDFLSNGFKIRNTDNAFNASGGNFIYMAFAENPFKYANAR